MSASTSTSSAAGPSTYLYTLIPFDSSQPLQELSAPVTPFESDSLKPAVASYFEREEAEASAGALASLRAAREAELVASFAQAGMAVPSAEVIASAAAPSKAAVDITLLTVPRAPEFVSVSLYCDPSARAKGRPLNARATALCLGAGHPATTEIRGDAFLSRCCDNEGGDVWERRSMGAAEAVPTAAWCVAAGRANAGRDTSAFSSAGLMAQMAGSSSSSSSGAASATASSAASKLLAPVDRLAWRESVPGDAAAYQWRRRAPAEIELQVALPSPALRAKDLAVTLTATRLGYSLKGGPEVQGPLGQPGGGKLTGKVAVEESSWQVEKGVLLITLALLDSGMGETSSFAWPRVFESEL